MELGHFKTLRILTILLACFLAIVSVAGAFFPGTYIRDSASMGAQGVGQDLVDLFVGVPLLLISFYHAAKGSRLFVLIYGGTLFYILYSFIIYCFGIHFNQFFLFYCLTLSLSLYSFILLFVVRGISEDFTIAFVFGALSVISVSISLLLFRKLKKGGST